MAWKLNTSASPKPANVAVVVRAPERMRGVEKERQVVPGGHGTESGNIAGAADIGRQRWRRSSGPMAASHADASSVHVSGSMSQKTGVMPIQSNAWAVATKVNDGTMTSPESRAARARTLSAVVALDRATQCFTPRRAANPLLELHDVGPMLVSTRRSSMACVRRRNASRPPMCGLPTCRVSEKHAGPPRIARTGLPVVMGETADRAIVRGRDPCALEEPHSGGVRNISGDERWRSAIRQGHRGLPSRGT